MPTVTVKPTAVADNTNFESTHGVGTEVQVVTDGNDGSSMNPVAAGDYITYDHADPVGDAGAPVLSVIVKIKAVGDSAAQIKPRVRLGAVVYEPSLTTVLSTTATWYEFSVPRPGGGAWILDDVRAAKYGMNAWNWISVSPKLAELEVEVTYERMPGQSEAVRDIASRALNARNRGRVIVALPGLPLHQGLDVELLSHVSLSHFAGLDPHHATSGRRTGYGRERWQRGVVRVTRRGVRTDEYVVDVTGRDVRRRLYTYRNSGRAARAVTELLDGVLRVGTGGLHGYTRTGDGYVENPGDLRFYRVGPDFPRYEARGFRMESGRTNLLLRSSFASQLTGLPAGSGSGTRVAEAAPPSPYLDSAVSNYALLLTAGDPHSSDGVQPWPATGSVAGGTDVRLGIVHLDDAGAQLGWRLQRGVDSWWWDDTSGAWQSGQVTNLLPVRTARDTDVSRKIGVGGSATTLTLSLVQPSGGTAARKNRAYHVQLEDGRWPTSPIVTDGATATRGADRHWVENDATKRALHAPRWSFRGGVIPQFAGADVAGGQRLVLWAARYDASNRYRLYYDGTSQALVLEAVRAGAAVTASKPWVPVRGQEYLVGARATSDEGELDLVARTLSVFVAGAKGTDAVRSGDPIEVDDADLYLGSDTVDQPFSGLLYDLEFSPVVLSDQEMAAEVF